MFFSKWCLLFFLNILNIKAEISDDTKTELILKIQDIGLECIEIEGATSDDVTELLSKKLPSRKQGKCLISCVMQKLKTQKPDGKLDDEEGRKLLEPIKKDDPIIFGKIEKLYRSCEKDANAQKDRCDVSFKLFECAEKGYKEVGLPDTLIF